MSDIGIPMMDRLRGGKSVWLSPDGSACSDCNGLPDAGEANGLPNGVSADIRKAQPLRLRVISAEKSCKQRSAREGSVNAEWHIYEMVEHSYSSMISGIVLRLQVAGWCRLVPETKAKAKAKVNKKTNTGNVKVSGKAVASVQKVNVQATQSWFRSHTDILEELDASGWLRTESVVDPMRVRCMLRDVSGIRPLLPPSSVGAFHDEGARLAWETAVESLARDGHGWLTPWGEVLTCGLHGHIEEVRRQGEHGDDIQHVADLREDWDDLRIRWRKDGSPMDDASRVMMDLADGNLQEALSSLVDSLYQEGWVRLGIHDMNSARTLLAEGIPSRLRPSRHVLSSLSWDMSVVYKTVNWPPEHFGIPATGTGGSTDTEWSR